MWNAKSRQRSVESNRLRLLEKRRMAGLADTREQHALQLAKAHIASGERIPRDYLSPKERFGGLMYKDYATKHRHGVSYALYTQAFRECMLAMAEKREPIWRNLDLVDSPLVAVARYNARKRGPHKKINRTSDGPTYDDGAPTPVEDDWEPGTRDTVYAPPLTSEQREARAKAKRAYLDTYDRELAQLLHSIDKPKPRSLI
jgi:hypothetical protein